MIVAQDVVMNMPLRGRILIVDDAPAIHDEFRKILVSSVETVASADGSPSKSANPQFEVVSAMQGEEGVRMVVTAIEGNPVTGAPPSPFAVAFVDDQIPPGWDGLKTIEELWRADPELQVVFCTDHHMNWRDIRERLGHRDNLIILNKPFFEAEVMQLAVALQKKWRLQRTLREHQMRTERLVEHRTEQLRATEDLLITKDQHLQLAANIADLGYWAVDAKSGEFTWSPNMYRMFDVQEHDFTPTLENMIELFADSDREKIREAVHAAVHQGQSSVFRGVVTVDGQVRYLYTRMHCEPNETDGSTSVFAVIQDVTEHEIDVLRIRHAALHDPLTDLPNRTKFNDSLANALRHGKNSLSETALIMLDLDNFKEINDNLGHPVGDALLKQIARRLESAVGDQGLGRPTGWRRVCHHPHFAEAIRRHSSTSREDVRISNRRF